MLTFKIVTAAVLFVSVVLRAVIDFLWKDKRTNKYRYTRNGFVIAAIGAAFLNGIILLVDEVQKGTKTDEEVKHRTEVENLMLGALTPDIIVELSTGPTYPTPPRIDLTPKKWT